VRAAVDPSVGHASAARCHRARGGGGERLLRSWRGRGRSSHGRGHPAPPGGRGRLWGSRADTSRRRTRGRRRIPRRPHAGRPRAEPRCARPDRRTHRARPARRAARAGMRARPVIAIVGRPNVGKSTLFNRLVGRRASIVRDVPGVTRDRLYGQVSLGRWQATVVDTGGFDPSPAEPLVDGVRRQVLAAVDEADLVLFVVDARAGVTALDLETARTLRRARRRVVLVANKVDATGLEAATAELYRLGFGEPLAVSAEHGRGVAEMLEVVRERAPASSVAPPAR